MQPENDDDGCGYFVNSKVTWNSVLGMKYYIQVTSSGGDGGMFALVVDGTDAPLVEAPGECSVRHT
jgi:hypothetical protein